jgi:hypothetical protein
VRWVPLGSYALYPFELLATWVHETGHGLTALLTGGSFDRLEIFADGSGLAYTGTYTHAAAGLTALGGLLAPPIVGATVLAVSRGPKRARGVLIGLAAAMTLTLILWVRSVAGFISVPLTAAGLGYMAWRGKPDRRQLLAQLVGLMLALDTATRMVDYVFRAEVKVNGVTGPSDIAHVAEGLGGDRGLWGSLVAAIGLALCALGLWLAWRPQKLSQPLKKK